MARLRRLIRSFDARLPSTVRGIDFLARIHGRLLCADLEDIDVERVACAIRAELRTIAARTSVKCDPGDIPDATDRCNEHLLQERTIPAYPRVFVSGQVSLRLPGAASAALEEVKAAMRKQAIEDTVRLQHAREIRRLFTDPSLLLSWWVSNAPDNPPDVDKLQRLLNIFRAYPETVDVPLEHQFLDLLRRFVAEFSEVHQRRAILDLLGSGFRAMGKDDLAAELISITATEPGAE